MPEDPTPDDARLAARLARWFARGRARPGTLAEGVRVVIASQCGELAAPGAASSEDGSRPLHHTP